MLSAIQRAVTAQSDISIKQRNRRVVMPFLLDFTILMVLQKNVIQDILAEAEPPIKPLAHLDSTPPKKGPLHASNAHLERMPTRLVPLIVKNVIPMHTNRNPMLRNAFQSKKASTNPVQRPK